MVATFRRLEGAVDSKVLAESCVAIVGCGGSHHFVTNLARSGVGRFLLIDPDVVAEENIRRTDFQAGELGMTKVGALARALLELGLDTKVEWRSEPVEGVRGGSSWLSRSSSLATHLYRPNLIVAATDSFSAQAFVNQIAVRERWPALFMGLASQGLGGEIVFWYPGLPCFRCLLAKRYELNQASANGNGSLDPASDGTTIFDTDFVDAVAGQIALGLLLRERACRFGRLLTALGDRNFLRLKIDPGYVLNGRDVVREELGVPIDNPHFFGWCVSALRDPARGLPPCPDCVAARHQSHQL